MNHVKLGMHDIETRCNGTKTVIKVLHGYRTPVDNAPIVEALSDCDLVVSMHLNSIPHNFCRTKSAITSI
jgi:hypothetical protein